ncbi:MAG: hypothetical protein HFG20_03990 [Anaerotruncus sp.]|nr:hypothetical protein [Anaerotruncus sp.]
MTGFVAAVGFSNLKAYGPARYKDAAATPAAQAQPQENHSFAQQAHETSMPEESVYITKTPDAQKQEEVDAQDWRTNQPGMPAHQGVEIGTGSMNGKGNPLIWQELGKLPEDLKDIPGLVGDMAKTEQELKAEEEAELEAKRKEEQKQEEEDEECQTCENRRYQDGSDDPGVSFKTPGKIAPQLSASVVRGHEMEHVFREQAKAEREDRDVVSQRVTLHLGVCPECGKAYVSGGTTETVTKGKQNLFKVGLSEDQKAGNGFFTAA